MSSTAWLCVPEWVRLDDWSAYDPWDRNTFPFVAAQFLTGLPQHMSMMGLCLLSCFPERTPPPPHPPRTLHTTLFCPFPKRLAFLGATSEAALEGSPLLLGGLLCTGSEGRRQCLINWLGVLGRVQEFAGGGDVKVGMSREGWRGGTRWPRPQIYFCLIYTAGRKVREVPMWKEVKQFCFC